jgi:hypothetical protein
LLEDEHNAAAIIGGDYIARREKNLGENSNSGKKSKMFIQPARATHLMKSIRIDLQKDVWADLEESVAVEPLEGTSEWVKLRILHITYENHVGTRDPDTIVKFYFDGREPEILE